MLLDQMQAEDIVQNIFIKLYENFDKIINHQSILFWLFKTTKNELMDHYRNKKSKAIYNYSLDPEEIALESKNSFEREFDNKEILHLIEAELNAMNPEFKEIFILREYSQLSYKEIATVLGINEELVKSRLFKIRKKLINNISKFVDE